MHRAARLLPLSLMACVTSASAGPDGAGSTHDPAPPQTRMERDAGPESATRTPTGALATARPPGAEAASPPAARPPTEPNSEPAPPPPPPPFAGQTEVTVDELVAALDPIVEAMLAAPAVTADYEGFLLAHKLEDTPRLRLDHARVRLAFETTRDGGLWGLRWDITNREPRSDEIWSQWQALEELPEALSGHTATAECDELSALFAFIGRRLGVEDLGLFWPTGNHTVAVWTITQASADPVRIVVPTSQVFLSPEASLGTLEFNPWRQKTIWEYRRKDAKGDLKIPAELARRFIQQAQEHAARPQAELQARRNRLGGS